ncbi:SH3 domain-containing protein [Candidatus Chloroploca sp. Khr17]|uniref:C40 family peptidase n=1 Tax=Candidatus Chloroploca sp. Khr17 TaxID=2496869 RepID=UPI00101D9D86|nr:SH3 domain-containing protein [Candidatus Chloroploca sp. Khr17]
MIELNRNQPSSDLRSSTEHLQQQASRRHDRYRQQSHPFAGLRSSGIVAFLHPRTWVSYLPTRFILHAIIALMIPLALLLSQLPTTVPVAPAPEASALFLPGEAAFGSVALQIEDGVPLVGDPPLDEHDALPVPISLSSRTELLAPLIVPATIAGDTVRLRNGPGLAYDDVDRVQVGTEIEVVARFEEWLQIRRVGEETLYWASAELVNIPEAVVYTLNQVPADVIPPPPPPKIGVVREESLNLRDGPGVNYVSMAKMTAGQELTLIQRYEEWFLVEYGSQYGWVTSEFLNIVDGVIERIPIASSIPDPNPPLVGMVLENRVNLRRGPGSAYDRVGSINADNNVKLLARHKDWYRVELENGTRAWIFSDLLRVSPMASRRVPVTNDIPALPVRTAVAQTRSSGGGGAPVSVPASGDVASYAVQFIGSRYVWGGSSPRGFDCSGLTSYVYRQFGVNLPHSAAGQYSTRYGAMIGSMGSLAPGDLMFFANTGGRRGISHVALYLGGGRMVHAMTPSYGVQASSIWSSYWQNTFVGAIRPYR